MAAMVVVSIFIAVQISLCGLFLSDTICFMKPILAIDIDGVLNRLSQARNDESEPWEARTIEVLLKDVPHSPFHRRQSEDIPNWPVTVNPTMHGPWLQSWAARGVEIVWATTWEHQANKCFAPFYGMGDWPVACSTVTFPPKFSEDTPDWKARCLEAYAGERPLIWLDDMNFAHAQLSISSASDNEAAWADYNDPAFTGFKSDDGPWGLEHFWGFQFKHVALNVNPRVGVDATIMGQVDAILNAWMK